MPRDMMTVCAIWTKYKVGEAYEWRWKSVAASEIVGIPEPKIRCLHCHGAVRLHTQQQEHGPQPHVEHRSRQDSEGCPGGHYFLGDEDVVESGVLIASPCYVACARRMRAPTHPEFGFIR